MASKLTQMMPRVLVHRLPRILFSYSRRGNYNQVHTQTTEHMRYKAVTSLLEQNVNCSFFYLLSLEDQFSATEDAVVHVDTSLISTV